MIAIYNNDKVIGKVRSNKMTLKKFSEFSNEGAGLTADEAITVIDACGRPYATIPQRKEA
jgi:hypothetical protein